MKPRGSLVTETDHSGEKQIEFPDVLARHPGHTGGGAHLYTLTSDAIEFRAVLHCTEQTIGTHDEARAKGWEFFFAWKMDEVPRWCPICRETAEAILQLKALTENP